MSEYNSIDLADAIIALVSGIIADKDAVIDERFAACERRWHSEDTPTTPARQMASPNGSSTHLPKLVQKAEQKVYELRGDAFGAIRTATATFLALREKEAEARHLAERLAADRETKRFEKEEFSDHDRKFIVDLHRHDVRPWHVDQIPQPIRAIMADLIRWYCIDPSRSDPASPWNGLLAQYSERTLLKPGNRCGASDARSLPEPPPPYRHRHIPDSYYRFQTPASATNALASPLSGQDGSILAEPRAVSEGVSGTMDHAEGGTADPPVLSAASAEQPALGASPTGMWDQIDLGPLPYLVEESEISNESDIKASQMQMPPFTSLDELNISPMNRSIIDSIKDSGDLDLSVKLIRNWSYRSDIPLDANETLVWVFLLVAVNLPHMVLSSDRKKIFHGLTFPGRRGSNSVRRILSVD